MGGYPEKCQECDETVGPVGLLDDRVSRQEIEVTVEEREGEVEETGGGGGLEEHNGIPEEKGDKVKTENNK